MIKKFLFRSSYILAAAFCSLGTPLLVSSAHADAIIDYGNSTLATVSSSGAGCTSEASLFCELTKNVYGASFDTPHVMSFRATAQGSHTFSETITNLTGAEWTEYHLLFDSTSGSLFLEPTDASMSVLGTLSGTVYDSFLFGIDYVFDSPVLVGETFNLTVSFDVGVDGDCQLGAPACTYSVLQYPVSPVPEPETYAMLLAGLGLLGFAARRRRQGKVF